MIGILLGDSLGEGQRPNMGVVWQGFFNSVCVGTVAILPGAELYLSSGSRLGDKG